MIAKNYVDHPVRVELEGNAVRFPPCREASKLDSFDREICRIDSGIPVVQSVYVHDPVKLPPQEKGTLWIVPKLMAELYRNERSDLVYPATNPRRDGAEIIDTKVKFVRYFRRPSTLEKR